LERHKKDVKKGFEWMKKHIPTAMNVVPSYMDRLIANHDQSKTGICEYDPYDDYFYGGCRTPAVVEAFEAAWLNHIHVNPHHWQHWVLVNDDPKEGAKALEMPSVYVVEMVCDWWSFSWSQRNLKSIFEWYDQHKDYIKLHKNTRKLVESILNQMYEALVEDTEDDNH